MEARGSNKVAKNFDNKGLIGIKSKYDEDLFEKGHTSVWGSYWH
jgi:hypothetical protein